MQEAVVRRVDPGLGMLLELRSGSPPEGAAAQQNGAHAGAAEPVLAGYAHISAVSDKRIEKLEKVRSTPLMHPFGRVMGKPRLSWKGRAAAAMTSTLNTALITWGLARRWCARNGVSTGFDALLYRHSSRDRL